MTTVDPSGFPCVCDFFQQQYRMEETKTPEKPPFHHNRA
jgi:hypothetical protein